MNEISAETRAESVGREADRSLDNSHSSARVLSVEATPSSHPPVALVDLTVPQLAEACQMLDQCQERYDKLSGICATMRGLVLTEAKRKLGHGKFLPWVAENFKKTKKTAAQDMRVAEEFCKSNPRVTFETLGRDLASTILELEQANIDLRHPLVREVAIWVGDRTRYQLLLDFPGSRGGDTSAHRSKKLLNKSPDEIKHEEAQIFYFPLQQQLFELLQPKIKQRLLHLPLEAPPQEASLFVLHGELEELLDLVKEAMKQKRGQRE
jgi:hypothetical protein